MAEPRRRLLPHLASLLLKYSYIIRYLFVFLWGKREELGRTESSKIEDRLGLEGESSRMVGKFWNDNNRKLIFCFCFMIFLSMLDDFCDFCLNLQKNLIRVRIEGAGLGRAVWCAMQQVL